MSLDLETTLISAALVASSVNSLLTTITLFHQVNEKMKLLQALQSVSKAMVTVVKKTPHPHFRRKPSNGPIASAGSVRRRRRSRKA
jgi:hypothetical protein